MNAASPIDPLYCFKSIPPNAFVMTIDVDGGQFGVSNKSKWRYVSQKAQDGVFLCEIVGGTNCGLRFFLPEGMSGAEKVED
ncbi:hypothetical protein UFOVP574_36 [uncultured Caudovirales phage]|uniref:Uncharacterized protein n=1 Tax=uncultured Caudovirales phage TaxID=2100421 RepID=A0A6J5MWW7_9CAUD|nr:hypothetical protein UFOVP574_36 [uncultured Caudovirales phage]